MHLRFEKEGSEAVSVSIKLVEYLKDDLDNNGCYDCYIPLSYFQCPFDPCQNAGPYPGPTRAITQLDKCPVPSRPEVPGYGFSACFCCISRQYILLTYS